MTTAIEIESKEFIPSTDEVMGTFRPSSQQLQLPEDIVHAFEEVESYKDSKVGHNLLLKSRLLSVLSGEKKKRQLQGWVKFMRKIEDIESQQKLQSDIASFRFGSDHSFNRKSSPEDVWNAVRRRAAWKSEPLRMMFLTFTQITLCIIVLVSSSSPINRGTLIMAILYIIATGASNPMSISNDAINYMKYASKKWGDVVVALLAIALLPITSLVFLITVTLDLIVGDILDISFAGACNIVVRMVVVFTAISVGLRSGNPINAIQTFAGFDFIDGMDEVVISSLDVDLEGLANDEIENQTQASGNRILAARVSVYVITPFIIAGFLYITIENSCFAFCTDSSL